MKSQHVSQRTMQCIVALCVAVAISATPLHWYPNGGLPLYTTCEKSAAEDPILFPFDSMDGSPQDSWVPFRFINLGWDELLIVGLVRGGGSLPEIRGDVLWSRNGGITWYCISKDDEIVARPGGEVFNAPRHSRSGHPDGNTTWGADGTSILCVAGGRRLMVNASGASRKLHNASRPIADVHCAELVQSVYSPFFAPPQLQWQRAPDLPSDVVGAVHFADESAYDLSDKQGDTRFAHHYLVGGSRGDMSQDVWLARFESERSPFLSGWGRVQVSSTSSAVRATNLKRSSLVWLPEARALLVSGGAVSLVEGIQDTPGSPVSGGGNASSPPFSSLVETIVRDNLRSVPLSNIDISTGGHVTDSHVTDSVSLRFPSAASIRSQVAAVPKETLFPVFIERSRHPLQLPQAGPYVSGIRPFVGLGHGVLPVSLSAGTDDFVEDVCVASPVACRPFLGQIGDTSFRLDVAAPASSVPRLMRVRTHITYSSSWFIPPVTSSSAPGILLGLFVPPDSTSSSGPARMAHILVADAITGALFRGSFDGCIVDRQCSAGTVPICRRPGVADCAWDPTVPTVMPEEVPPPTLLPCAYLDTSQAHWLSACLVLEFALAAVLVGWDALRARHSNTPVGRQSAASGIVRALFAVPRLLAVGSMCVSISVGIILMARLQAGIPNFSAEAVSGLQALVALALLQPIVTLAALAVVKRVYPQMQVVATVWRSVGHHGATGLLSVCCAGWHPSMLCWILHEQAQRFKAGGRSRFDGTAPSSSTVLAVSFFHAALVDAPIVGTSVSLSNSSVCPSSTVATISWPLLLLFGMASWRICETLSLIAAAMIAKRADSSGVHYNTKSAAAGHVVSWTNEVAGIRPHVAAPDFSSSLNTGNMQEPESGNPLRTAVHQQLQPAAASASPPQMPRAFPREILSVVDLARIAATPEGQRIADHGLFFRSHPELLPRAYIALQSDPLPTRWLMLLRHLEAAVPLDEEELATHLDDAARELMIALDEDGPTGPLSSSMSHNGPEDTCLDP